MKKITFWAVWLLLCPLVALFYIGSDILNGRFRNPSWWLKMGLVRQASYERTVLGKPFIEDPAERELRELKERAQGRYRKAKW